MTKRYFIISLLLCSICFTASAQEMIVEYIEAPAVTCQGDIRDIMYAAPSTDGPQKARQFANPGEAVVDYIDRITNMPQYLHTFIENFIEAGQTVLNGGSSWLSDPTLGVRGSDSYYFPLKNETAEMPFYFTPNADGNTIKQAAAAAFSEVYNREVDILRSFLPYAFLSLNHDHPEFFWIGNGYNYSRGYSYQLSYYPSLGTGTITYTINFQFTLLSNDFDIRTIGLPGYNFRDLTDLASGLQRFKSSVQTILNQCPASGSRYDKLLAAHDWLTQHNCYNYFYYDYGYGQNDIGDTPWSAFSAIEGNNGQQAPVCEGYSRAFKVLCDKMDIPCILMAGIVTNGSGNTGGHMWNYVQMEDEQWYAVDVTWDDPSSKYVHDVVSGYESHDWFLLGSTSDVSDGLTFIESHPEGWLNSYPSSGSQTWDLRQGPVLSPTAYSPAGNFDPYDINRDGAVDEKDIRLMAEAIAEGNNDVEDFDGNGRISIGDLVRLITHFLIK